MAVTQTIAVLCLLLASGLARPIENQSARSLLQSDPPALTAFKTLVKNGANAAVLSKAFQAVLGSGATDDQKAAALNEALKTSNGTKSSSTATVAQALATTASSSPGSAKAVGNVVSKALPGTTNPADTGAVTNAAALLKVVCTSGICKGSVVSTAEASAAATNATASAVAFAISEVQPPAVAANVTASAAVCATAIGNAWALAITSVNITGTVNGDGTVEGAGAADASAFAKTFSKATADAFALATNGRDQAVAAVSTEAFTSAVANVTSSSCASLIQQGAGTSTVSVTTIAFDYVEAISEAIATALAFVAGPATTG